MNSIHQFSFSLFFMKLSLSQYHQFSRGVRDFILKVNLYYLRGETTLNQVFFFLLSMYIYVFGNISC